MVITLLILLPTIVWEEYRHYIKKKLQKKKMMMEWGGCVDR